MIDELELVLNKNSDMVAYHYEDDSITYKELLDKVSIYASYLRKQGTGPVILLDNNEIDEFVSMLACLFAKRTYIPVGICIPSERLNKIIDLTNASLIITNSVIDTKIDCIGLDNLHKYSNLEEKISFNDTAYIIFTSGSTGEPKGVPISYDNLNNFIKWISSFECLKEYKCISVFNQASFSFDLSVAAIYYSLFNGHTLVGCNIDWDNNYDMVLSTIKETNLMVVTPTFIKLCLLDMDFNCVNYPKLDCIYFCGEKLESKVVKKILSRFPKINIINAYGPTEATSAVSGVLITNDMLDYELPVGDMKNLATNIQIINEKIILSGKSLSKGYINDYQGGFYTDNGINYYDTGDIGYIRNNYLYCKGRCDNQIKYKGYRIELGEIEYYLNCNEKVEDAVIVPKYDLNNNIKFLKAFIVGNVSESEIKRYLKNKLPFYMIPQNICIVDKLPINKNGKIDRKKLIEL